MLLGASDDGAVEGIPEASRSTSSGAYPTLRVTRTCSTYRRWSSSKDCAILRAGSSYGSGSPWGRPSTRSKGAVYDRVADADVRVKSDAQIASMMAHKQSYYSERTVHSWVTEDDLEMGLLGAVRDALRANDADRPWLSLSDGELLCAARLYGRD